MFWDSALRLLAKGPAALITVARTSGSVPRRAGARMLLAADGATAGTVGGGAAEADCLRAARAALGSGLPAKVEIDLRGHTDELRHGVCGGTMTLFITPLPDAQSLEAIAELRDALAGGRTIAVETRLDVPPFLRVVDPSAEATPSKTDVCHTQILVPPPLLFIAGAGHIGRAVASMAEKLEFRVAVFDEREQWLEPAAFPAGQQLVPDMDQAAEFLSAWSGVRFVLLVTRGLQADLVVLEHLAPHFSGLTYLGILGSERRIAVLRKCCAEQEMPAWPAPVTHAPVGLPIGAETPEEIAVSILAEIIRVRRGEGIRRGSAG